MWKGLIVVISTANKIVDNPIDFMSSIVPSNVKSLTAQIFILFWLNLSVFPKNYGHVILFQLEFLGLFLHRGSFQSYCMPVPCLCNISPFVLLSFSLDLETDSNSFIIFRHGVIYLWCDRKTLVSSTYWLILTSFSSLMAIPFISGLDLIVSVSGSDCIINKSAEIAFLV